MTRSPGTIRLSYDLRREVFNIHPDVQNGKGEGVLIYQPEVLGDTYEEIVKSLNYLADAELVLRIAPRKKRKTRSV